MLIPTVGLVLWLVHLVQVVTGSRPAWARWACLVGVPVASIASYLYWSFAVFSKSNTAPGMQFSRADSVLLGNAFFGLAASVVFLVLEPVLVLVGRQVAARRGSPTAR